MKVGMRWLVALGAALALLLAACGEPEQNQAEDDETEATNDLGLIEEGQLRVGSDINFAPFEFIEDGEEKGFDIDLMNEIAERLGLRVEYVNTSFDSLLPQLAQGEFDAAISSLTITDERDKTVDFSDPYFEANQALVAKRGSDIDGVEDLEGKDVGVQAATTGLSYAQENFTDADITEFQDAPAGFTALAADQIDAMFIDLPVALEQVEQDADLELVEEVETNEQYGIAVQEGNSDLVDAINDALQDIIEDGTYAEIFEEWFEGAEIPEAFASADADDDASGDASEDASGDASGSATGVSDDDNGATGGSGADDDDETSPAPTRSPTTRTPSPTATATISPTATATAS